MAVYCISYELKGKNYETLLEAIKSYGTWWHQSESTWFIETNLTAKQVLENLKNFIGNNDKLIVIRVYENWWAVGHTEEEYSWIRKRNF